MSSIQLITGLANPGKEYADTRHNAGAWLVDNLAERSRTDMRFEAKFHGLHGAMRSDGHTCQLLIPTTFMNLSGQSVRACMNYYKLAPAAVLIVHDDIDLPPGVVRLKFDGGDGGHNGLKDIIAHLNTKQFYRLRIGVGRPTHHSVVDYVLSPPSKADREKIMTGLEQAEAVLPLILDGQISKAMQQLHSDDKKTP